MSKLTFHTPSTHRPQSHTTAANQLHTPNRHKFVAPIDDTERCIDTTNNNEQCTDLIVRNVDIIDLYNTDDKLILADQSMIEYETENITALQQQSNSATIYYQQCIDTNTQFLASIAEQLHDLHGVIEQIQNLYTDDDTHLSLITDTATLIQQYNKQSDTVKHNITQTITDNTKKHLQRLQEHIHHAEQHEQASNAAAAAKAETQAKQKQEQLEQEQKQQADKAAQQKQQEESKKQTQPVPISTTQSTPTTGTAVPETENPAVQDAERRITIAKQIQQVATQYNAPDRLQMKALITRTINQLSGTVQQVKSKTQILIQLIRGSNNDEIKLCYIINEICQKLVAQGRSRIARHSAIAYAVAVVAVQLCIVEVKFVDVLLGQLYMVCHYTIPKTITRQQYNTKHDYLLALGYEVIDNENNSTDIEYDTEEVYYERVSGYMTLYAAYLQVPAPTHPHGIQYAWIYVARLLNSKMTSITALLLYSFLSTATYTLHGNYPEQTLKLLQLVQHDVLPHLSSNTEPRKAAKQRLENWLESTVQQIQQTGKPVEPEGRSLPAGQESDTSVQEVTAADQYAE